jgi:hypothetical protein
MRVVQKGLLRHGSFFTAVSIHEIHRIAVAIDIRSMVSWRRGGTIEPWITL